MDHKNQVSGDWTFFETWQGKAFSTEIKRKTIKNETENYFHCMTASFIILDDSPCTLFF